jgi:ArsR family transcriptional regulator
MLKAKELDQLKKSITSDNSRLVEIFDCLKDTNRCNLFRLSIKDSNVNVSDAARILGLSVPLVSQHFRILDNKRLLVKNKRGKEVFYTINKDDPMVRSIAEVVKGQ